MKVRHPPGRAGRPWLVHRLQVAQRGAELLDEKHRALLRERRRLEPRVAKARERWERSAREAGRWLVRAAVLGGERQMRLARPAATSRAEVSISWRTILGVTCPDEVRVAPGSHAGMSERGAGAALLVAALAHRDAVEAAAQLGVVAGALARIESELRATALRRNAMERRWIPAHEETLAALELTLEEIEREDAMRVRWVTRGQTPGASSGR